MIGGCHEGGGLPKAQPLKATSPQVRQTSRQTNLMQLFRLGLRPFLVGSGAGLLVGSVSNGLVWSIGIWI